MIRSRIFAINCGYEDCDELRYDLAFKMACERLPDSGHALASQPTLSRLENTPSWRELARMRLVNQARTAGLTLRQSYKRVGKKTLIQHQRYAHPYPSLLGTSLRENEIRSVDQGRGQRRGSSRGLFR